MYIIFQQNGARGLFGVAHGGGWRGLRKDGGPAAMGDTVAMRDAVAMRAPSAAPHLVCDGYKVQGAMCKVVHVREMEGGRWMVAGG